MTESTAASAAARALPSDTRLPCLQCGTAYSRGASSLPAPAMHRRLYVLLHRGAGSDLQALPVCCLDSTGITGSFHSLSAIHLACCGKLGESTRGISHESRTSCCSNPSRCCTRYPLRSRSQQGTRGAAELRGAARARARRPAAATAEQSRNGRRCSRRCSRRFRCS